MGRYAGYQERFPPGEVCIRTFSKPGVDDVRD